MVMVKSIIIYLVLLSGSQAANYQLIYNTSLEHKYFCECVNAIIAKYFMEKTYVPVPLMIVLDKNNIIDEYLLGTLLKLKWSIYVKELSMCETGNYVPQTNLNYIFYVNSTEDVQRYVTILKTNNPFWDYTVKLFIISRSETDQHVKRVQTILREEDIHGFLIIYSTNTYNYKCYVFKPLYCNFRKCWWNKVNKENINYCSRGNLTHVQNVTVYQNKPKVYYKIGAVNRYPYFFNTSAHLDGINYKIINILAQILNISFTYVTTSKSFDYGDVFLNGTAKGIINLLQKKRVDVALGDYSYTYTRAANFYPSSSYLQSELRWCVPHESITDFNLPIDNHIPLVIFLLFILLSVIFFLYTAKECTSKLQSFRAAMFKTFAIIVSAPIKLPKSGRLRLVISLTLLLNLFFEIFLYSFTESSITDLKSVEKYDSIQTVIDNNLILNALSTEKPYMSLLQYVDMIQDCDDIKKCLDDVAYKKDCAMVISHVDKEYILKDYKNENRTLLYCMEPLLKFPVTIYMRRGFPYYKKITEKLYLLMANGLVTKFTRDFIPLTAKVKDDNANMLKFDNLVPIFITLLSLYFICIIVFIYELGQKNKIQEI